MALFLKQSTAVVVSFGPFLDKTDGVTEETGLVSSLDNGTTGIKLSKNGGALTIRHATVTATTYDAYGMYRVTLDTTDTNTLGTLRMAFNEAATCLPVWQDFMILPANVYDSLVSGSDLIDVSMTQILGTAVSTPATAGVLDVNVKNAGNTAWASGAIVAGAIATGAITNAKFAAGAIDAAVIADGSIDNATFAADVGSTAYATNKIALAADKAIANAALATAANLAIVDDFLDTEIAAIKAKTDNLPAAPAAVGDIPTAVANAAQVRTNLTTELGRIDAAISSRSTYAGGDTAGVTTLLSRIIGTLAAGTHNPQTGDSFAQIGAAGAGLTALGDTRIANLDAAVSSRLAAAGYTAPPSAAANASQVRTELTTELARIDVATSTRLATAGYTAPLDAAGIRTAVGLATANLDTQLAADLAQATLARKILKNRTETNPATGVMTIYDDDGTTPLYTANLYTDVAGATPYAGTAAVNRRNALA